MSKISTMNPEQIETYISKQAMGESKLFQMMKARSAKGARKFVIDLDEGTVAEVSHDDVSADHGIQNVYLPDEVWNGLSAELLEASKERLDPQSAIKIGLAAAGVMPESCREDCEAA